MLLKTKTYKKNAVIIMAFTYLLSATNTMYAAENELTIPKIHVSASAEVFAKPDVATINGQVNINAKTPEQAAQDAQKIVASILSQLKNSKIDPDTIDAGHVQIQQRWIYNENTRKADGFDATRQISVKKIPIKNYPAVISAVLQGGITEVQGIEFGFNDPEKMENTAIENAVKNATKKAELVARAANGTLGDAIEIQVNSNQVTPIAMPKMRMAAMAADESYSPGEQSLGASVSVIFNWKP
ncbi:MAG: SIMPL domain-containing protein [Pseudomonadota bacterium]